MDCLGFPHLTAILGACVAIPPSKSRPRPPSWSRSASTSSTCPSPTKSTGMAKSGMHRFDYVPQHVVSPSAGPSTTIYRPMVTVTILGLRSEYSLVGLLDTGADDCVLPIRLLSIIELRSMIKRPVGIISRASVGKGTTRSSATSGFRSTSWAVLCSALGQQQLRSSRIGKTRSSATRGSWSTSPRASTGPAAS